MAPRSQLPSQSWTRRSSRGLGEGPPKEVRLNRRSLDLRRPRASQQNLVRENRPLQGTSPLLLRPDTTVRYSPFRRGEYGRGLVPGLPGSRHAFQMFAVAAAAVVSAVALPAV